MNTRVYFNNVAASTTERELIDLFSIYGNVVDVHIRPDHVSDERGGCGFVTMITPEGARAAVQALSGKAFGSGTLTLSEAPPEGSPTGREMPRRRASSLY